METVEYIELFWDCPECGKRHISAVFNSQGNRCPQCLYWRTETVELYEAPDSQVIRDRTLIERKPSWVCKVCNAVNEDTGLAVDLLQCSNCNSYQTSGVGDITGDVESDRKAPDLVAVGEPVSFQEALTNPANLVNAPSKKKINPIKAGLMAILAVGGISGIWLSQQSTSPQVRVTDLQWTTEVDLQQQETFTHQGWDELVPSGASIVRSQTKQRDTRQQQRGSRTIFVEERYQSGTRSETYTTSERYQSGTRSETYTTSERYQSSTRSETYTTSERYQSGSKQECKTTSLGNGLGKRTCRDIPVYSTRQVPKTRTVPVYSTRQVPRTRTVPVYSTRQVPRTRTVPVYSTRQVPIQEPIYVTLPVYDQWVTYQVKEWVTLQTYNRTGRDNAPTLPPTVKLSQQAPQRISNPRTTCRLYGTYEVKDNWLQPSKLQSKVWVLPCQEYDLIDIGDRVPLSDLAPKRK
jgi:hypothetical protein